MTIRFGVAGTGYWAREIHLRALMTMAGVTVTGVWGRSANAARDIARMCGIAAYSDFGRMLGDVDAVTIAVPPSAQPALAIAAADAGKHMLLEKPVALAIEEALNVQQAIARNRVAALVFFMRRFVPEIESAVRIAATQPWQRAEVEVHSSAMSTASPYRDSKWRQLPGAALWDIGPHVLSILTPVLGAVEGISAVHHRDGRTTLETIHAKGAHAAVSLTLHSDPDSAKSRYRFFGTDRCSELPEPTFSHQAALQAAVTALLSRISDPASEHACDVAMGVEVIRLLELAQRSVSMSLDILE